MIKKLRGNKVYLGTIAGGMLGLATSMGWIEIDGATFKALAWFIGTFTTVAVRAAYAKGR